MAGWTTPVDRSTGYVVTASDWNATGQDDLTFLAGSNAAVISTLETTTSTSYGALTTAGPVVTVTTGAHALLIVSFLGMTSVGGDGAAMSVAVSGATTLAASDSNRAQNNNTQNASVCCGSIISGLNAGSNTFTANYKAVVGGTATFSQRWLIVIPLP